MLCSSGKLDCMTCAVVSIPHCAVVEGRLDFDGNKNRHKRFAVFSK
jgi:hypothetical protein